MRKAALLIAMSLLACGCSAQAAREPVASSPVASAVAPATSADGNWRFVEIGGVPVPTGVMATFRLHAGQASGKAGCNAYGARWNALADGGGSFGPPRSTKMACMTPAGVMQVEHGVFDALSHVARMRRDGDGLWLLDAAGKPLAHLQAAAN